jgi:hypothetical protein
MMGLKSGTVSPGDRISQKRNINKEEKKLEFFIIMSPALFKIVLAMCVYCPDQCFFDRKFTMIKRLKITGVMFIQDCMFFQGKSRCIPC